MTEIVIIGAGSDLGSCLSPDIVSREVLRDVTIALCDVHSGCLRQVTDYVKRVSEKHNSLQSFFRPRIAAICCWEWTT